MSRGRSQLAGSLNIDRPICPFARILFHSFHRHEIFPSCIECMRVDDERRVRTDNIFLNDITIKHNLTAKSNQRDDVKLCDQVKSKLLWKSGYRCYQFLMLVYCRFTMPSDPSLSRLESELRDKEPRREFITTHGQLKVAPLFSQLTSCLSVSLYVCIDDIISGGRTKEALIEVNTLEIRRIKTVMGTG